MSRLLTGLDLGSSNIRVAVCEIGINKKPNLLALESKPSTGISQGIVAGLDAAKNEISTLLQKVEKKINRRIRSLTVSLGTPGIKGEMATGIVGLSKRPRQITKSDIEKCKRIAGLIDLPAEREVIHKELHSFYINENDRVENPLGLFATKLITKIYIITAESSTLMNLTNCIQHAGYLIDGFIYAGKALLQTVLKEEDKSRDVLIIDIGSHLTNITLAEKGALKFMSNFAVGTMNLKDKPLINRFFETVKAKAEGVDYSKVMMTGGGALEEGVIESAEENMNVPCEIGRVRAKWCFLGSKDALLHTISLGLIICKAKMLDTKKNENHPVRRATQFIANIFEDYF